MSKLELKIPPVFVFAIALVLGWATARATPEWSISVAGNDLVAWIFIFCGLGVGVAGVRTFRAARTTVNPMKPHEATTLVRNGVYRRTRNPMYLGLLLLLIAWAAHRANLGALLIMPVFFIAYMNRFQIIPEERALTALFKDEYTHYMREVRRWI